MGNSAFILYRLTAVCFLLFVCQIAGASYSAAGHTRPLRRMTSLLMELESQLQTFPNLSQQARDRRSSINIEPRHQELRREAGTECSLLLNGLRWLKTVHLQEEFTS